jgi:hypothetical protein
MFVPMPPPPSREARELAGYLQQVIDAYQQDHPELNANDISRALTLTRAAHGSRAALAAKIAAMAVLGGMMVVFASQSSEGEVMWVVLGAVVLMMLLAVFKAKRL